MQIDIIEIESNSKYLIGIKELWRKNSNTLGFMPHGGFIDYAEQGHILAAIHSEKECIGYLMYRVSNYKAHIIHLCTDNNWRRMGIARKLVNYLINKTQKQNLYGIEFLCRRDYNLHPMWSSFHFIPKNEKVGKSKEGHLLTLWVFEHECPHLMKLLIEQKVKSKIKAIIDANIFFDLQTDDSERESSESKYLLVDWLQEEVELCLTDEIYTEIDRNHDVNKRYVNRQYAKQFTILPISSANIDIIYTSLSTIFPNPETLQDKSDLRQLSRAIASNAQVFITRDQEILGFESQIYNKFNIQVIRPTDLIIQFDQLIRSSEYHPIRLAGTTIKKQRVRQGEQDKIINQFLMYSKQEKKTSFKHTLQKFLAEPSRYECFFIQDNSSQTESNEDENLLALFVYNWYNKNQLEIPLLRVKNHVLGKVILRHLILDFIWTSSNKKSSFTKITDDFLDDFIIQSLQEDLFIEEKNGWIKPNIVFSGTAVELSTKLKECQSLSSTTDSILSQLIQFLSNNPTVSSELAVFLERFLYPAKIIDTAIPNFIIPIQARWAEHLFDTYLASQGLFGARQDLAFKRELVYYRSILNSAGLSAPSRILWYVSQSQSYCGTGTIRACSLVEKIVIDKPKEIYRRFRRLGVYGFNDVLKVAREDLNQEIMAICFRDTELFKTSIDLNKVQEIIDKKSSFPSPYKISQESFKILYNIGMNISRTRE